MNPTSRTLLWMSWVLRVGVVMEFVGHGALGISRVAAWSSYFAVVGIPKDMAMTLMPLVGAFDVATAMAVLFYPFRAVVLYMGFWGLWTAVLRPLAGESAWEAVERAGNFGALGALFMLAKTGGWRSWMSFEPLGELPGRLEKRVSWMLRLTTVLLLVGHGALGLLVHKKALGLQYSSLGIQAPWFEPAVGAFECLLGLAVLAWPTFGLLVFVLFWKLATEALAPMAGSPVWVFIEHGGSYAAPLALAIWVKAREKPVLAAARQSGRAGPAAASQAQSLLSSGVI
jgi:hypothetical protein